MRRSASSLLDELAFLAGCGTLAAVVAMAWLRSPAKPVFPSAKLAAGETPVPVATLGTEGTGAAGVAATTGAEAGGVGTGAGDAGMGTGWAGLAGRTAIALAAPSAAKVP